MQMLNCDVWSEVDFGKGPVEVRCTMLGKHNNHGCQIAFTNLKVIKEDDEPIQESRHSNIFENKAED
jgi:hypothetical protein